MRASGVVMFVSVALAGCGASDITDLMADGVNRTIVGTATPAVVGSCVTTRLDQEEWSVGTLLTPVSRSRVIEPGGIVELQGQVPNDAYVFLWRALISPTPTGSSSALTVSRDGYGFVGGEYLADKIEKHFQACAAG